jgi:hypothetical protein
MWGACPPYASIANASFQNEFFHLSAHLNDGTEGGIIEAFFSPGKFRGAIVMDGSFFVQKEEPDGYHACCPISWSQAY